MRTRAVLLALVLSGCGGVLPHDSEITSVKFDSYGQVMTAYDRIDPGKTRMKDLTGTGFDPVATPNIEVLSQMDIAQRFLPADGITLANLPPAVRSCLEAQYRCTGYVYRLQQMHKQRDGGVVPDLLGIERDSVNTGWAAEIVLIVDDGSVVYKTMSGSPHLEERNDRSQPLGPLQNVGSTLTGSDPQQ